MLSPIVALSTAWIVTIIILIAVVAALVAITIWGNKQQKKSEEAQEQLRAAAQPMTLLVIDKKRVKLKDANLPKVVVENVPKRMRRTKVPVVLARVNGRTMTFMCDASIYDMIPVKREVKAMVGGIYILSVKALRGPALTPPSKKTAWQRAKERFLG